MRPVLVFALIAIFVFVPAMTALVVVAGLTLDDSAASRVESAPPLLVESVALRSLTLLRAPPV